VEFAVFPLVVELDSSSFSCQEIINYQIGCEMIKLWSVVLEVSGSLVNVDVAQMHFEKNASKVGIICSTDNLNHVTNSFGESCRDRYVQVSKGPVYPPCPPCISTNAHGRSPCRCLCQ
jgi:hypothetical protein